MGIGALSGSMDISKNDSEIQVEGPDTDTSASSENVPQVPHLPKTDSSAATEECDLRNQEGADRYISAVKKLGEEGRE